MTTALDEADPNEGGGESPTPASTPPPPRVGVLQVLPSLSAGGAERATIDVARALGRARFLAVVASEGGRLEGELKRTAAQTVRMPVASKNPLVILANAFRLMRLIRFYRIGLVHARSRAPAWSALLAARRMGVPIVTTYHGIYRAANPLKRFYNSIMVRGDAVIANSEWTAEHIRRSYGAIRARIVTIPRGIDADLFDPARVPAERRAAVRADWGADASDRVILLPGRLTRWKGQEVFIAALAMLERGGLLEHVRAVIAGDAQGRDNYVAELKAAIARERLADTIVVSDHIEDMAAAYAAADIVVSASTEPEAFGRVAAEASAMKRPVIATDHGGARETVVASETGLLVEPGDPVALAEALAALLVATPEKREAMGEKGRAHILARYTVETMCADTLALYRDLMR